MSDLLIVNAQNLDGLNGIKHGFFGRKGGTSSGIYSSLNCGFSSNDNPKNVKQNRQKICDFFGIESVSYTHLDVYKRQHKSRIMGPRYKCAMGIHF